MIDHTYLLNLIANRIKAYHYLEIGVFDVAHNFNKIIVPFKEGVDPAVDHPLVAKMTSDEFFNPLKIANYDLIFIDGLHHADQVRKDLSNSWGCLNPGGVVALHDTNPHSEHITHVPRDNGEWCGNCYVTASEVVNPFKFTVDVDYGLTIIRKEYNNEMISLDGDFDPSWENFDKRRKLYLNLKSINESLSIINSWT